MSHFGGHTAQLSPLDDSKRHPTPTSFDFEPILADNTCSPLVASFYMYSTLGKRGEICWMEGLTEFGGAFVESLQGGICPTWVARASGCAHRRIVTELLVSTRHPAKR